MSIGGFVRDSRIEPDAGVAWPALEEREERGLDPEDWDALASLGHRMVEDVVRYHRGVRDRPAWQAPQEADVAAMNGALPEHGIGEAAAYAAFAEHIMPYPYGNIHPRHWGWVNGTGTTLGAFAEMLAAAMNSNCWGGNHSAILVELRVLDWLRTALGLPLLESGLLVSGGSEANLVGLSAARDAATGAPGAGLQRRERPLVLYCSAETHNSVNKSVSLLGIGVDHLRAVPVDAELRMDVAVLRRMIAEDRANGFDPFCVVATVGTVNTGSIDPIDAIADVCSSEQLWLHVDGAFGAVAALSPALRPLLRGMERADSVAFDLHKWLHIPIEAAAIFVRTRADHARPFTSVAKYLAAQDRGIPNGHVFSDLGPQLTRGFRAAKAWLSFMAHGMDRYRDLVEQNVQQARYLGRLVDATADLQLLAPVALNVVAFRFVGDGVPDERLNAVNIELLMRLQESGIAAPSGTVLNGAFCIRCAITNHRSSKSDFDVLVKSMREIGRSITEDMTQVHATY